MEVDLARRRAYLFAAHPVLGKPVQSRRCPATVREDKGPSLPPRRAGRRAPGRIPSQETGRMILLSAFRGEGAASGNLLLARFLRLERAGFLCLALFRGCDIHAEE